MFKTCVSQRFGDGEIRVVHSNVLADKCDSDRRVTLGTNRTGEVTPAVKVSLATPEV